MSNYQLPLQSRWRLRSCIDRTDRQQIVLQLLGNGSRRGWHRESRIPNRPKALDKIYVRQGEQPRGGSRFVVMVITACALSSGLSIMREMPPPEMIVEVQP